MEYRKATKADIDQLARMRWDFQTESEKASPVWEKEEFIKSCEDFYSQVLDSQDWIFFIAEFDNQVIAHVAILIVDNFPTPLKPVNRWGYLTNTFTKKEFRGKGVGSGLIKYAIDEVKSLKIETMIVWPSEKSIDFYKRAGFNKSAEIMELSFDDVN